MKVLDGQGDLLENVLGHENGNRIVVIFGDVLLKIAPSHVLHHNTSLGLVGEVFFEADNVGAALTTSPHLDLMTNEIFLPLLQVALLNYPYYKLFIC